MRRPSSVRTGMFWKFGEAELCTTMPFAMYCSPDTAMSYMGTGRLILDALDVHFEILTADNLGKIGGGRRHSQPDRSR